MKVKFSVKAKEFLKSKNVKFLLLKRLEPGPTYEFRVAETAPNDNNQKVIYLSVEGLVKKEKVPDDSWKKRRP